MTKTAAKRPFPVEKARQILEPGPVVLVSSAHKGRNNIMTMGWHMVMEFTPSLIGCIIASSNHSFDMIRKSKECVINVPDARMIDTVVKIGNADGGAMDKFETFGLTAAAADMVAAPMIGECFASFECRLHDGRMIDRYNLFIFEVVKAHVAAPSKFRRTLHYHGQGKFSEDGAKAISKSRLFTKWRGSPVY